MAHYDKYGNITVENDNGTHPLNDSDEPIFMFRAQDALLVPLLARYKNMRVQAVPDGSDPPYEWLTDLDAHVERILTWQQENPDRVKLPD